MNARTLLAVLVAVAVPFALVGNGLLALAHGWLPNAVYPLPGFPDDDYGFAGGERLRLAHVGIDAIQPWDAGGMEALRTAGKDDGTRAFNARELIHMQDVRDVMTDFMAAWALALAVLGGALLAARGHPPRRAAIRRGLVWGAAGSVVVLGVLGLGLLLFFDTFFTAFHGVFFPGDSWRFPRTDTLRRLYPYEFWGIAGAVLAALVIVQALALAAVARGRRRRAPSGQPVTA